MDRGSRSAGRKFRINDVPVKNVLKEELLKQHHGKYRCLVDKKNLAKNVRGQRCARRISGKKKNQGIKIVLRSWNTLGFRLRIEEKKVQQGFQLKVY